MTKLRVDHTGLNSTLFLMRRGIIRTVITVGLKKMLSMSYLTVFSTRWKDGCCKIGFRRKGVSGT